MPVVLAINPDDSRTLQTQVFEEFRRLILDGKLRSGAPMPGSRALSEQLGVSRNTIIIAYEKLLSEGYIESRANVGTFVSTNLPEASMRAVARAAQGVEEAANETLFLPTAMSPPEIQTLVNPDARRLVTDFWIGNSDPKAFPAREWRRTVETKLRYNTGRLSVYSDPQGLAEFRQAIADHIGPARGIIADPEDIVIIGGAQDGLTLIARMFAGHRDQFLHEDPCYQGARALFGAFGYHCSPIPVDRQGIEVDQLPEQRALLYVTPSHQFPIGVTMSLERRLRLLDWAERTDSLIIEDDYDGDFRYEGAPLSALRGLDRTGRVLYLGTFAKSFGPGLRLGFVIASQGTSRLARDWKLLCSNGAPWLEQAAMAEFMDNGGFRRHLRRIRAIYMARRDVLLDELKRHFPGCEIFGHRAGMHLSWRLPEGGGDAERLQKMAALQRIGIYRPGTSASWISPQNTRHRDHLLMGYAVTDEKQIRQAVASLAACMTKKATPS